MFSQKMIPSLSKAGKLILETKSNIFKNPDGHGGSLTALQASGTLKILEEKGIETISYFQALNYPVGTVWKIELSVNFNFSILAEPSFLSD